MDCNWLFSISESLSYICSLLSPFGFHHLSSQTLLLAAANHPSVSSSMWSFLHQLICLQLASPSSSRSIENVLLLRKKDTSPDVITGFVKFYLSFWGFPYTSLVFSLSYDTGESQHLLVALAWLISRCDIFQRALKARINKLLPYLSLATITDISNISTAMERARQGRAKSKNYIDKLIVASNKIADVGLRVRSRSQQTLMLYGRVRISIMTLHSLLSSRAKLMHNLNQLQVDFEIKNQECYPYSQFDIHLLENREALENHFATLEAMKNIGEEMTQCKKHEKTFWQWMVAVTLNLKISWNVEIPSLQKLKVLSKFCTISILPVVKYLNQQLIEQEDLIGFSNKSILVEPLAEGLVTNLKQLSLLDLNNEEVHRLFQKIFFQFQGVTFVYETTSTDNLHCTANFDAKSIFERLKLVATTFLQALAQTRIRNRICLEETMDRYISKGYILHNF